MGTGETAGDLRATMWLRAGGLMLLTAACIVPLTDATAATADGSPSIVGLPLSRWLFAALLVAVLAGTVIELRPRYRERARMVVFTIATVTLLTPLLLVAALEALTAVASPDLLPPVLQDLPLRAEPLMGIWLLIAGAGLVMLSASGSAGPAVIHLRTLLGGLRARRAESFAVLLGATGVILFVVGRYENWMRIDSNVADWNVVAQSAPVVGLASLMVLALCGICVVAASIRPSVPLGVATLTIGWIATLVPATMLVIGRATPSVTAPGWLRSRLTDWSSRGTELAAGLPDSVPVGVPELPETLEVELMVGRGTTMLFTAGLLVGLSGLLVIRTACTERTR